MVRFSSHPTRPPRSSPSKIRAAFRAHVRARAFEYHEAAAARAELREPVSFRALARALPNPNGDCAESRRTFLSAVRAAVHACEQETVDVPGWSLSICGFEATREYEKRGGPRGLTVDGGEWLVFACALARKKQRRGSLLCCGRIGELGHGPEEEEDRSFEPRVEHLFLVAGTGSVYKWCEGARCPVAFSIEELFEYGPRCGVWYSQKCPRHPHMTKRPCVLTCERCFARS